MKENRILSKWERFYFARVYDEYEPSREAFWSKHTWSDPIETLKIVAKDRRTHHFNVVKRFIDDNG